MESQNVMGQQEYRWWYRQGGSRLASYMREKCNRCSARYNQSRKELNHSSSLSEFILIWWMHVQNPPDGVFCHGCVFKHFLSIWSHLEIPGKCFAYCRFLATTRKGVAKVPRTLFAILKSFEGFALQKVSQALKHSTCTTVFGHPFGSARLIMVGAILEHLEMCRWFWRNLPIKNGFSEVSMLSWPYI